MKRNPQDLDDIFEAPPEIRKIPEYNGILAHRMEEQIQSLRFRTTLCGVLIAAFLFLFLVLFLQKTRTQPPEPYVTSAEGSLFVPRHTLPENSRWVMTYKPTAAPSSSSAKTDQPISTQWVKEVAYHLIIGQQAMALDQYKKAIYHFENALEIFPEIHGVRGLLGTAFLRDHKLGQAVFHLEQALRKDESFAILSNLGSALMATDQLSRAESYHLQALALEPNHPGCHKNLALLYRQMEQPEKALLHFETYLDLYKKDLDTLKLYAEYLVEIGQEDQGIEFLDAYCQQNNDENTQPLYLLLAKIEAQSTNNHHAVSTLKKMTRYISPTLALAQLNLAEFDPIRKSDEFKTLVQQVELAMITLKESPQ